MVGSVAKGKASASKSKCEAFTLLSADSEPVKSSAEEANASALVGEGENNEISGKDEKSVDGQKTGENVCGPVIVNGNEDREQVVDEGHDEDRDAVNEIKVSKVGYVPISKKTQGYAEEMNNGDGVANMEEMTTQGVLVKDNETVIYDLDIKDVNIGEERKSLEAVAENLVGGDGVAYAKTVNDGGSLANANEKTTQEMLVQDNVTVFCGLEIKDVNTREERKSSEVVANNIIDGGGLANPEDVNGGGCVANTQETTPQELPIKENGVVIDGLEISHVNSREERNSLDMFKDGMIDGSLAVSLHQTTDKNLTDNLHNEKEADKLNAEVSLGVILDSGKRECRVEDASIAPNVKATPENFKPQRRRLNRKAFEKMVLNNNEASINDVQALSSTGNDSCNNANEADSNEHLKNDNKGEAKPLVGVGKKLKRMRRKKVREGHDVIIAANDELASKPMNKPQNKENKKTDDQDLNNEAEKSGDRMSKLQRINQRKVEKEHGIKVGAKRSKSSKGVDFLGMIFMCSSETKEDCYRYRVLGLPAAKKDMVLNIYKGMRLFLFDVNLKMMYGIYKAAGRGGYDIEPSAFRSQFPSQVRFTVIEDCVPLAEGKFRSVIKDNYYTKTKFNCQLTSAQVINLCKLFHETTKRAKSKLVLRSRIAMAPSSVHQDRKRKRGEDSVRVRPNSSMEQERSWIPSEEGARHYPMLVSATRDHDPINCERHLTYERETHPLSMVPPPLYQRLPAQDTPHSLSFLCSDTPMVDMYRRDLALEHHEPPLCDCGRPHGLDHHDPYVSYVEAHAYHEPAYDTGAVLAYREPAYDTDAVHAYLEPAYGPDAVHAYREPAYETSVGPECHDCYSDTHGVEYYGSVEYCPPLPQYGRL